MKGQKEPPLAFANKIKVFAKFNFSEYLLHSTLQCVKLPGYRVVQIIHAKPSEK